jgi:hypothetical protein
MIDEKEYYDEISRYLNGTMDAAERERFEGRLSSDEDFAALVEELKSLQTALRDQDELSESHVDPSLIVDYATDPEKLDEKTRRKISEHIKTCSDCEREVTLSRQTHHLALSLDTRPAVPWYTSVFEALFSPRYAIRPAYAVIVLALLAIPAIMAIRSSQQMGTGLKSYEITPGTRGEPGGNIIDIDRNTNAISMRFTPPLRSNCPECTYEVQLNNPKGNAILMLPNLKAQKVLVVELLSSYFREEGIYSLKVIEKTDHGSEEIETYPFSVRITK